MADSVSVEHGGVTVTTNTASEADLRAELTTPEAAPAESPAAPPAAEAAPAAPVRDDKGRFARTEAATPPAETPETPEPTPEPEPPARRRDDTLPRHDRIARMRQALVQKAEADRRVEALEAELARYRQPPLPGVTGPVTPPAPPPAPTKGGVGAEPQFDQFANEPDPYTAYSQAWTRWEARNIAAQEVTQARAAWEAEQKLKAREQAFAQSLQTGRTTYPNFDQVLTEADTLGLQVSAVMQDAIAESPRAADLVYFLATHPEECIQLAEASQQTPVNADTVMPIRQLLELQLQSLPAPRAVPSNGTGAAARASVSNAKPPVTPVGSSPVVSDEPPGESASAAEHSRYWNRKLKVPGTR